MPAVLTESSTVTCGHGPASVSTQGQSKLTVANARVLAQGGVAGKAVSGCVTQDDTNTGTLKCRLVAAVTTGAASKLTIGGAPVFLDTLAGTTNGNLGAPPPPPISATAGQTKLTAL